MGAYAAGVMSRLRPLTTFGPRRAAAVVAAAAVACLAVPAAEATPPGGVFATSFAKFRYDAGSEAFKGRIESPDERCVKDRKVTAVFETKQPGTELVLGNDRAGASGKFKIKVKGGPPRKGKYYGLARGKQSLCDLGYSKPIRLKPS